MIKKIFISSTEKQSGKSLVTIGLISALQGIVPKIGYMKPIGQRFRKGSMIDEDALMIKDIFQLKEDPAVLNPITLNDAQTDEDVMFEKIFDSYREISKEKDIVVIEGTDYTSAISALEFDINAELAQNLAAPVILIARADDRTVEEIIRNVTECVDSFRELGCTLLGTIINRLNSKNPESDAFKLKTALEKKKIPVFGVLLNNPAISGPRLKEVSIQLGATPVFQGDRMDKVVTGTRILAMTPENALSHLKDKEGYLLITSGDRAEHIFTIISAQKSASYPHFSGMILTGGIVPSSNVRELMEGIADIDFTILSVPDDTFTAAMKINSIVGELSQDDPERIEMARFLVERYVDIHRIYSDLGSVKSDIVTPKMFQYRLIETAKSDLKHIVLPEGAEPRILEAAEEILNKGICDLTLLGDKEIILEIIKKRELIIDPSKIIDPRENESRIEDYTETYYQCRKHKGITHEMARDSILDTVVYAAMMVYKGHADGYVSGAIHSTADTLRPVLRLIRTKPEVSLASSVFFMCMPEKVLVFGDCALVESPNAEQLADIAITSATTAESFGVEPKIAMLSYSTGKSGKGEMVDKIREATRIVKEKRPDLLIEGPIQYDAAISQEVATIKLKDSKVAGKATIYIFPDLDAGNTAYKAVQQTGNLPALGPIIQGLNKPANDLSRGTTVTDIIYTVAITAIQAQHG
jgi:phosphate acetyltransferase